MVRLHIKLNGIANAVTCNRILCSYTHTLDPWTGSKVKTFFLKVVMLHIKLEGNVAWITMKAHVLFLHTPRLLGRGQMSKRIFLKVIMLYIKLYKIQWSIEHNQSTYSILTHTLNLWVGLKGIKNSECGHVAYQIID